MSLHFAVALEESKRLVIQTLPADVITGFGWQGQIASIDSTKPGMSGASVFRVRLASGDEFAVKRYPSGTSPDRVEWIHRIMMQTLAAGCDLVPRLHRTAIGNSTVCRSGHHCWEAARWKPGRPLQSATQRRNILSGVRAIADFHRCHRTTENQRACSSGLGDRMSILADHGKEFPAVEQSAWLANRFVQQSAPPGRLIGHRSEQVSRLQQTIGKSLRLLSEHWPSQSRSLRRSLSRWAPKRQLSHWVLRDVHREHILFDEDAKTENPQPTAFLDFDAVRIEWPVFDLTRWAGSFIAHQVEDGAGIREYWGEVAGHYDEDVDVELLETIHAASTWISLMHWIGWIAEGRQFAAGSEAVALRMDDLCEAAVILTWSPS